MAVAGTRTAVRCGFAAVGFSMVAAGMDMVVLESDSVGNMFSRTVFERPGDDRGVMILTPRSGGYVLAGMAGQSDSTSGNFAVFWLDRS